MEEHNHVLVNYVFMAGGTCSLGKHVYSTGKVHPRPRYSALRPDILGLHTHASLYIVAQLSQGFSLGELQRDHAAPRKSEKKLTGSTLIG